MSTTCCFVAYRMFVCALGERKSLSHFLLARYIKVLQIGCRARASCRGDLVQEFYFRQNDACMLRLFEAFLESAPQLTLQLYIMVATCDAESITGETVVRLAA